MDESSDESPATVAECSSAWGSERGETSLAGSQAVRRHRQLKEEVRELIRENSALRAENTTLHQLCRDYLSAKQQLDHMSSFLEDVFGSGVWNSIRNLKRIRAVEAGRNDLGAILARRDAPLQARDQDDRADGRAGLCRGPKPPTMAGRRERRRIP